MAYTPVTMYFPDIPPLTAVLSTNTTSLSTIGYGFGAILDCPVTDTITKIGFRTSAINASTIEVRVETVTAGLPSGTLWGTNTNGTVTLLASDDNAYFEVTLTSSASVNRGDKVAIVVITNTATAGTFLSNINNGNPFSGFPYAVINSAGTWTRSASSGATTTVYFGTSGYVQTSPITPFSSINSHTYNNTSTPDVYANIITPDFNCKTDGVRFFADLDGDVNIKLYDTDGQTVIATATILSDQPPITGVSSSLIYFDNEVTLSSGSSYYLGIEPSSGTSITIYSFTSYNSSVKANFVGSEAIYATAKDPHTGGAWTTDNTRVIPIALHISAVDDGAGGGGGLAANPVRGFIG